MAHLVVVVLLCALSTAGFAWDRRAIHGTSAGTDVASLPYPGAAFASPAKRHSSCLLWGQTDCCGRTYFLLLLLCLSSWLLYWNEEADVVVYSRRVGLEVVPWGFLDVCGGGGNERRAMTPVQR